MEATVKRTAAHATLIYITEFDLFEAQRSDFLSSAFQIF